MLSNHLLDFRDSLNKTMVYIHYISLPHRKSFISIQNLDLVNSFKPL